MYPGLPSPAAASSIFTGEDQRPPPFDELRYQTFQASGLSLPEVCMYHMRTSPPPDDASRGPGASSPATESGPPALHVRPSSEAVATYPRCGPPVAVGPSYAKTRWPGASETTEVWPM